MSWRLGRAYSQDLRDKIMAAFDAGEPARDVAEWFSVSVSYIDKAGLRRRRTGDTVPGAQRNQVPLRLEPHREAILGLSPSVLTPRWPSCGNGLQPSAA